jgi:glycosyltransferase involved in cell wall biosynthesis
MKPANQTNSPSAPVSSPQVEAVPQVEAAPQVEAMVLGQIDRLETLVGSAVPAPLPAPELTILQVVDRVRRLPIRKQIIVVDDGSTDGTRTQLESLRGDPEVQVHLHSVNCGKGAALQSGFKLARGPIVIVQDADLEYDPEDILKVIEPIRQGQADVVYGSRYLGTGSHDDAWLHRLGNRFLTAFSNRMTGQRLTDMETCYKAIRRELLNQIEVQQKRFGFEPEITAKLARKKVTIQEVGIRYQARSWHEGKKIGVRDLFNALYCIVRYSLFA